MKIHKISILAGLVAGISMWGCQDNRQANMSPNTVYIVNTDTVQAVVYNTGADNVFTIGVTKSGYVNVPAFADLAVSAQALALYNAKYGQALEQLPADCYSIPEHQVNFKADQTDGAFSITFHNDKLIALGSSLSKYGLPVELTKSDVQVNFGKKYTVIKPVVAQPYVSMTRAGELMVQVDKNSKTLIVDLPVTVPFANNWTIGCDFATLQTDFDAMNLKKGGALTLMPEEAYNYPASISMEKGKQQAILQTTIDRTKLSYAAYCLPIRLNAITGQDYVAPNAQSAVSYIMINTLLPIVREGWSIVNFSSESANEGTNGPAKLNLDGDINTYWHSEWGGANATSNQDNWITIDMGQPWILGAVVITPRQNNAGAQIGYVMVADNENGPWTYVGNFATNGKDPDQSFPVKPTACRYFKLFLPSTGLDPDGKPIKANATGVALKTANAMMGEINAAGGPVS